MNILNLSAEELSVLKFLVCIDPNWGEPLKHFWGGTDHEYGSFDEYAVLKQLAAKVMSLCNCRK